MSDQITPPKKKINARKYLQRSSLLENLKKVASDEVFCITLEKTERSLLHMALHSDNFPNSMITMERVMHLERIFEVYTLRKKISPPL